MLTGDQADTTMLIITLLQTFVAPSISCNKSFLNLSEKFQNILVKYHIICLHDMTVCMLLPSTNGEILSNASTQSIQNRMGCDTDAIEELNLTDVSKTKEDL